jgi:ppGpp synthetase/RelA/SpoT-type nucleotidyltranferase
MDTVKDSVIQMIHRMPDTASVQDIMAELYFRQKVDAGLKALDENKGIEHSAVKERLKKTGSSIRRKSHHIGSAIRPKRIADVVGLRILADEDWKETGAELKKIIKDTLKRLEKSY